VGGVVVAAVVSLLEAQIHHWLSLAEEEEEEILYLDQV
jgi:hypothetical protein